MCERADPRPSEAGFTLVEMVSYISVTATMLTLLAGSMLHLSRSARASIDVARLQEQARQITGRIAEEFAQSSTQRDHMEPDNLTLPLPDNSPSSTVNEAYIFPAVPIGTLHNTQDRDGTEFFQAADPDRRFYIYATYSPFDTLQFQKVRWDVDQAVSTGGEVRTSWSAPRKVFLRGDQVLMCVPEAGTVRTYVLGDQVTSLEFHLTRTGELEVRLQLRAAESGVSLDQTITLPARNNLG